MNYEYCIPSAREANAVKNRSTVLKELDIDLSPSETEKFISMFGFDNSIYEHVKLTKTVSGFKGNYFCKFLYFDIDNDDNQEQSLEMARNFCLLLYTMLNISPNDLFISFSGNKGFHIGIHGNLFGGFGARKDMPDRINVLAVRVLMECFETSMEEIQRIASESYKATSKRIFNDMDLSIYNANRIFRVINSKHSKSGLYKIGMTYDELNTLSLEQIKELAKEPRTFKLTFTPAALIPNEELKGLWQYALAFDFANYKEKQIAQGKSAAFAGFYAPGKGNRNNDLFKQAAMLFDKSSLNDDQIGQIIGLINNNCEEPLPNSEIEDIVKSAFKKTLPNRVIKAEEAKVTKDVENFGDWFSEWADYYTQEAKPFSCLFEEIAVDQERNLQGKLAAFIGKGGTKKSYAALNVVADNILNNGARAIYSSMEMGKVEMVNRILDVSFPVEEGLPASKLYRTMVKKDKQELKDLIARAAKILYDNLILSSVSKMTTDKYYEFYRRSVELYGPIDLLAIDGLSMMGGSGSESDRFERHTMELKDMANQTNMFIPLICHTTKDAKPYMRDVSEYVRGSGKILDNCDFLLSFSNLIDVYKSTPENIHYVQGMGNLKYYNKRGTGMMLDKIFNFDRLSKCITPSNAELLDFPDYDKFVADYKIKNRPKKASKLF